MNSTLQHSLAREVAVPAGATEGPRGALPFLVALIIPAMIGLIAFLVLVGSAVLDPRNIAWMASDDPATYYIGWSFFRRGGWGWPPSANPEYGLEIGSTLFFSDTIPLFALLAKLLIAPATGPWQYHGWWILFCFILHSVFAWRLLSIFVIHPRVLCLATLLFIFVPIFLVRLEMHFALCAQWVLLAALWLCLKPPGRYAWLGWLALLTVTSLIHSYLLAMVAALWASDLIRRRIFLSMKPFIAIAEAMAAGCFMAAGLWLAGFSFLDGDGLDAAGFGILNANILTFVDSNGWSFFIPSLPGRQGNYEGSAFLGAGVLLLLGAAAFAARRGFRPGRFPRPLLPLAVSLSVLLLFAMSNRWTLGPFEILVIPLPETAERAAGLFRSSGRFIWPVTYAVMIAAVILTAKAFSGRTALRLFLAAALLQCVDTSAGWVRATDRFNARGEAWPKTLRDSFWADAAQRYRLIRHVPPRNGGDHWQELSYYALNGGMATDAAYLARIPRHAMAALRARATESLATGRFDADTLFVLDAAAARQAVWAIDPATDLLIQLDGLFVLAPGWLRFASPPPAAVMVGASFSPLPLLALGRALTISEGSQGPTPLLAGWNKSDPTTTGRVASLAFELPPRLPPSFVVRLHLAMPPSHVNQRVVVRTGSGRTAAEWVLAPQQQEMTGDISLTAQDMSGRDGVPVLFLVFELPSAQTLDGATADGPAVLLLRSVELRPAAL